MGLFKSSKKTRNLEQAFGVPLHDTRSPFRKGKDAAAEKVKGKVDPKITRKPKPKTAAKFKPKEVVDPKKGHKDSKKPEPRKKGFFG